MDDIRKTVSDRLEGQIASWSAVRIESTCSFTFHDAVEIGRSNNYKIVKHQYTSTGAGRKFFDYVGEMTGGLTQRYQGFDDGERHITIEYELTDRNRQRFYSIRAMSKAKEPVSSVTLPPRPFDFWSNEGKPLHEGVLSATSLGETNVDGRVCDAFSFPTKTDRGEPADYVYHVDRLASIPIRFQYRRPKESGDGLVVAREWTATSLAKRDGHWYPDKSVEISYKKSVDGSALERHMTVDIKVDKIEFNQKYPSSHFVAPAPQPGARVFDVTGAKSKSYVVPADTKTTAPKPVPVAESAAPVVSVPVAEPPRDWTGPVSGVGLALSGLLLVIGIYQKARRSKGG